MRLMDAVVIKIKKMLQEKHMSKYALCKKAGLDVSSLRWLFNSEQKDIKLFTLYEICATLDTPLAEFFDDPIFNKVDD